MRNVTLAGGTPPEAEPVILGTLKVASSIDSWLSSASFIRTAGVLTEAAIEGDVDHLLDLKSNVIVGKQIPAGTGLSAYHDVELTYHGTKIDGPDARRSPRACPSGRPTSSRASRSSCPSSSTGSATTIGFGGVYSKNGRTLSSEDAKLYLFDDLGVSQRWTNKFSEVGIETVGDLIGKTEDDLLRIDGIGAKAIEELRDGLEARGLLYILEPEDDEADSEDLSQLLNMVFSPDADADIMLGTAAPATHHFEDDELIGGASDDASVQRRRRRHQRGPWLPGRPALPGREVRVLRRGVGASRQAHSTARGGSIRGRLFCAVRVAWVPPIPPPAPFSPKQRAFAYVRRTCAYILLIQSKIDVRRWPHGRVQDTQESRSRSLPTTTGRPTPCAPASRSAGSSCSTS